MRIEICEKACKSDLQSDSGACNNSNPKSMLSFCQYHDVPSRYYPDIYMLCIKNGVPYVVNHRWETNCYTPHDS